MVMLVPGQRLDAETLRVVGGPARRREFRSRGRSRRRAAWRRSSGSFQTVISSGAPMVFVQVAFATSTVLPTRRELAVRAGLAVAAPGDVVDLLLQVALRVQPAFDDLDAVEIGADRIFQRGAQGRSATCPAGACVRSPPIGHALAIADDGRARACWRRPFRSPSRRRSARSCAGRWWRRFPCAASRPRSTARVFSVAHTAA